jgi:hypothetical protein
VERKTEESLKVSAKKPPSWCALRLSFPTISEDFTIFDDIDLSQALSKLQISILIIPKAVNQIPTTGQAAKKKCKERELLKLAYWKINRPK